MESKISAKAVGVFLGPPKTQWLAVIKKLGEIHFDSRHFIGHSLGLM